jgi:hypothetical protein
MRFWVALAAVAVSGCRDDAVANPVPQAPKIVFVTDVPSHGPGEHEYYAGGTLLATILEQSPEALPTAVVRGGFPDDPSIFDRARTIVFFTNGRDQHPLLVGDRMARVEAQLARGAGLVLIHWSTDFPEAEGARVERWVGGYATFGASVFSVWHPAFAALPAHPIANGVPPFDQSDEWYFGLRFVPSSPALVPILHATPPDDLRTTPETASRLGQDETLAWAYERADGGRSFAFVGAHYHVNWGRAEIRRLVVNAILWTAKLDVPPNGAPVDMDPALLQRNLDPKP